MWVSVVIGASVLALHQELSSPVLAYQIKPKSFIWRAVTGSVNDQVCLHVAGVVE